MPDPAEDQYTAEEDERREQEYAAIARKMKLLNQTFTPTRPVQAREIFAGRKEQLFECLALTQHIGAHGILYGDRGVGKTSIANMVHLIADTGELESQVLKIECTSSDSFEGIVKQCYAQIKVTVANDNFGFATPAIDADPVPLLSLMSERTSYNPKDVAFIFKQSAGQVLIILDEFDRLDHCAFSLSAFTELLKIISDTGVDVHFLVVGVGESVDQIIGNHASVVRNLTQIKLGAMNAAEIRQIIINGLDRLDLALAETLVARIVDFSCGYPHYTHLLCLNACGNAIKSGRSRVSEADVDFAVSRALSRAQESIRNSYHNAVMANRTNIYKEVLLACGQAPLDQYNTFVPKDIEKPLSRILKRPMKVNQFGAHLINLCRPERGQILTSIGEKGRARYRFRDPLMRAYVRLSAASGR